MALLRTVDDINAFWSAVDSCEKEVWIRSVDGSEEINAKSIMGRYLAIADLTKEHANQYEIFCSNRADETRMLNFFAEIKD